MRALILANGDRPALRELRRLRREHDVFIAADGALNRLPSDLAPDITIGDFDSLDTKYRSGELEANLQHVEDQERSVLQKALEFALSLGANEVTLAGVWGDRSDHTLVALGLLLTYSWRASLRIVRGRDRLWLAGDDNRIEGKPGDTLSLIALSIASGVSLQGVRWPLRDEVLHPGSRGVSNEMIADAATLIVKNGAVIVCHTRRP
jgi:thiamine pyrophosphokinase